MSTIWICVCVCVCAVVMGWVTRKPGPWILKLPAHQTHAITSVFLTFPFSASQKPPTTTTTTVNEDHDSSGTLTQAPEADKTVVQVCNYYQWNFIDPLKPLLTYSPITFLVSIYIVNKITSKSGKYYDTITIKSIWILPLFIYIPILFTMNWNENWRNFNLYGHNFL